jgi:large conductance mechanosensitive channel
MKFLDEFKKFAFRGNVIDLAVGVVIGGAFGKIVSALVADIVMPIVSLVMVSGDWRNGGLVLRRAGTPEDDVVLRYGDLLGSVLDFLIISLVLFLIVGKLVRAAERHLSTGPAGPATRACPFCLENVPVKATRCKACTSELEAAA